jgi:hypothetical protein
MLLADKKEDGGGGNGAGGRVMWLQMLAMAFQMAYGQTEAIEIKKAAQ